MEMFLVKGSYTISYKIHLWNSDRHPSAFCGETEQLTQKKLFLFKISTLKGEEPKNKFYEIKALRLPLHTLHTFMEKNYWEELKLPG